MYLENTDQNCAFWICVFVSTSCISCTDLLCQTGVLNETGNCIYCTPVAEEKTDATCSIGNCSLSRGVILIPFVVAWVYFLGYGVYLIVQSVNAYSRRFSDSI
eukprot:TRINITY_DN11094_c0_g1_i1.p1 TRINITY_DN11094_c0_g1~~TRINITY_DN11094_c0_g1_i1.p1  ORF type:complete len:103 (+),score=6.40 TRINITY_DN11094_c0_g1_i1:307-615(+)